MLLRYNIYCNQTRYLKAICYYENGDIWGEEYYYGDARHREPINGIDQPAVIKYHPGKKIKRVEYHYSDQLFRNQPNEPVIIKYNIKGEIVYQKILRKY